MKKVAALLVLALAALTLVACGGGDSDTAATTAETTAESKGGGAEGGGSEGGGSVIKIDAVEGSGLEFVQKSVTTKAGPATIEFTNPQSLGHNVEIEDASGEEVAATEVITDSKTTASIDDLKPGKYTFYCSVPGHEEAGMKGTLTVK